MFMQQEEQNKASKPKQQKVLTKKEGTKTHLNSKKVASNRSNKGGMKVL